VTDGNALAAEPRAGLLREARIDLNAFADNLRSLIAKYGEIALDARADAHGHSLALIVPVAMQLGVQGYVASGRSALPPADKLHVVAAAAYGVDPRSETTPVMSLVGEVVSVKPVPEGSGVSYGYSYRTERDTTLSLVGLGYADGIPRLASNVASVWVGGAVHPLVGRVAMDQFVVDSGDADVVVGDEAVVFGDGVQGHPTAVSWAKQTRRSPLELTAAIGPRVRRVAIGGDGG
jgi:alanine racemase